MTARDLSETGELIEVCMHCETPLLIEEHSSRWVGPAQVVALGYFLDGYVPEDEEGEGGCRGGACGVRQR